MRKTLIAMMGLVALGLWAMPALAERSSNDPMKAPPKVSEPVPLENRAGIWQTRLGGSKYQGTLSGTLIQDATPTTTWFMYPGSCGDRINGVPGTMGTWSPRSTPQADSLDNPMVSSPPYTGPPYVNGTTGPYDIVDQSLSEILWRITDSTPAAETPAQISAVGTAPFRMLWCGKFDQNWVVKVGYPNLTYQILYLDTGDHGTSGTYTLQFKHQFSSELKYDFVYLIGGGGSGAVDPLGNSRAQLDIVIADGHGPDDPTPSNIQYLLVTWTGSITGGESFVTGTLPHNNLGAASGAPVTSTSTYTIGWQHRALYLVFKADCLFSSEDGLWPEGHGQIIDDLKINGADFYVNDAQLTNSGGFPCTDSHQGVVLKGTVTDDLNRIATPTISARVAPGVGENWHLVDGLGLPTPDVCTPKKGSTDLIFVAGTSISHATIKNEFESVVNCSFYVPTGTASVVSLFDEYLDLPRFQGFVQYAEFRIHKDGSWGNWDNTSPGGGVSTGARQSWGPDGDELAAATQADSFQVRYNMQCIPFFAADHNNCGAVTYGVMYDNFRIEIVTGTPQPIFGVFVGAVAQSMFVDGGIPGSVNCTASQITNHQCWPGPRGSNIGTAAAVHDNFNSPLGDSITLSLATGLRKNGKGMNWHHGFDKSVNAGMTIAHTQPTLPNNALADARGFKKGDYWGTGKLCDEPRIIYRIFDPTSKSWSPFDSSELDANAVSVQAGDTVLIDSEYRVNWPPRDKAGQPLPGGFTVNGLGNYDQLNFMPKGSRIQYYWKAVDINCGSSYQFSSDALAREVEDLPILPNSGGIVAPDIIEFDVLPRVYAAGAAGTLLDGKTDTPILDLDGSYTRWNFGSHATVQILRSLGVRADRYRTLQGLEEGGHIGGHEFEGTRQGRLSNYFPNPDEYFIKDLLAAQYRIMIESSHTSTTVADEETDSKLIADWWAEPTGNNGGDRCVFASGDDFFNALLQVGGVPHPNENNLASQVFGVAAVSNAWNGNLANQQPLIRDMFADPAAGGAWPTGFGTPGNYTYIVDGGCPAPNRFDALTPIGGGEALASALYPLFSGVSNTAAIAHLTELDVPSGDFDRSKALGYGYSIQFIRQGGMNNVDARAQVLYKFLTSCRGPRTTETGICWPCPSNASPIPANWATSTVFQIGTYGPLYPIQDATRFLTGVDASDGAPAVNRLQGNFPNPFNPETAIRFSSARDGRAEVRIFDVAGRLVQTLSKNVTKGVNEVRWNGKSSNGTTLASGVYFVKVKNADGSESQNSLKIAIVR